MAVINTGTLLKAHWPGVLDFFQKGAVDFPAQYAKIFDQRNSSQGREDIVEYTGFGLAAVKAEGTAGQYDSQLQGNTARFVHVAYENGYIVTQEEIDDNLYPQLSSARAQELRRSMERTKEYIHANVLNRAFNTDYTGPDGATLAATSHSYVTGYTFQNRPTVDVALNEAAIEDMIILLQACTDARGLPAMLQQRRLIIPRDLQFEAARILQSPYRAGGADNDINVLKAQGVIPEILVWQYLTSTTAWFVQTDAQNGLLTMNRKPVTLREDNDFDTLNAKYKAYMRFSAGYANPQAVFATDGA